MANSSTETETESELISELEVLRRWPALSKSTLRAARKAGRISWIKGKRGSAWYRVTAIKSFINAEMEIPCRDRVHDQNTLAAINGSQKSRGAPAGTGFGLTKEQEELAAHLCAQRILK